MLSSEYWRDIQKANYKNLDKLLDFLEFSENNKKLLLSSPKFSLNIPRRLVDKMKKNDPHDPIFRQFVPLRDEALISTNFSTSPVADESFQKSKKLLKKYEGRALLLVTSACAMHCRFCFRQNYSYETENKGFEEELSLLREDSSIFEVILSGGDPLSLSDSTLEALIDDLSDVPHLKILRFHTRFLIGIPERITDSFLNILSSSRLQIIFVIHINHPLELDEEVLYAIKSMKRLGIPILSHNVLLFGVNDTFEILKSLYLKSIANGILPYYLNQLDKLQGASHFEVPIEKGLQLVNELRKQLPGYAIPEYIQEIPGEASKTPLATLHTI